MPAKKTHLKFNSLPRISFYLLCSLMFAIPLIFSEYFFSGFDLVKNSALKILGGLFIILFSFQILSGLFGNKKYKFFTDSSVDPFVILFILTALFSTVFSLNPYVSFYGTYTRQIGLITFIYLFVIYFLASQIFKDEDKLKKVLAVMEISAVLVAIYAIMQALQIDPFGIHIIKEGGKISSRPVTSLGHPNFAAGLFILMLPFSLSNIFKNKLSFIRLLSPVVLIAGIFVTQSRGAYAAFIAEIVLFFFLYPVLIKQDKKQAAKILKSGLLIISAAVLFIVILLFFFPASPYSIRLTKIPVYDPRWLLWRDSIKVFLQYPFTGTGIGLFPQVFETVITMELKRAETLTYYDNPHNNFINTLCTMGIAGLIAYVLILSQGIRTSLKSIREKINPDKKFLFYAVFISFCGYIVFGITNFDDISILLYLFVLFALLKTLYSKNTDPNSANKIDKFKNVLAPVLIILIIFSGYNIYSSYTELKADRLYKQSAEPFNHGDFKSFVNYINEAIALSPQCPDYKYNLANNAYIYALQTPGLTNEMKTSLLNQAKDEITRAEVNYHSKIECRILLSLIYYEMGNSVEGDKIKNEILARDTISVTYRVGLAMHYIKIRDFENAERNLNTALHFAPYYPLYYMVLIKYWEAKGNQEEVKKTCYELLKIEPDNSFAIQTLKKLK